MNSQTEPWFNAAESNGVARRDRDWVERLSSMTEVQADADEHGLMVSVTGNQVVLSRP